ncbi:GLUG domain-containing protein [Calothrix parasitica NIES-267]|uniref:GLUG domain-containing protein n=1 Tax=Calothrix parasitica NIES-267 TaxID=1973488 RepID=A0A1Z4LJY3_9CYAN|nr:GLUG domain-containing protein [Calothrix parasitica NIES-267]
MGTTVDLNNVDKDNDTITIDNHGFSTGDQVIYSNGSGASIDGLTDGDTYNVLVIDSNTIKLTKDTAIDIDNTGLNSNIKPRMGSI